MLCDKCDLTFSTEHSLNNHVKSYHQPSVQLGSVVVQRGSDGLFECPLHDRKGRSAQFVRNHYRCFVPTTDHSSTTNAVDDELEENGTEDPTLNRFDLGYDSQHGYIYCKSCKGVLSQSFENHVRKVHGLTISLQEADNIRSEFPINCFQIDFNVVNNPLEYLTTLNGYICLNCKWKGLTKKSIDEHLKKRSMCSGYEACQLQSASIGRSKKYFQVFSTEHVPLSEEVDLDQLLFNSSEILRSAVTPSEDFRTRRQFFTDRGWFVVEEEILLFMNNRMWEFSECPTDLANEGETILGWIKAFLDDVVNWDVHHRRMLSSEGHTFRYLQLESSKAAYSRTMAECLFFAINFKRNEIDFFYTPSPSIRLSVIEFERSRTVSTLLDLMYKLSMEPISSTTRTCSSVMTFLRVSCLLQDGTFVKEEKIGQKAAHIAYMIRMTYYLWHRQSDDRWRTLRENIHVLHGDDMAVPASVFMLLKDAKKAASEQRPPTAIFEIQSGYEIKFFNHRIRYDEFPPILNASRSNALRLLTQLSLGLTIPPIDTEKVNEDFSDMTSGYTMTYNSQQPTETFLTRLIYQNSSLRAQFIESIENGKIKWHAEAVFKYLQVYNDFVEEIVFLCHLTSGMPARGTELETYSIRNSASSQRSMFLKGNKLFFYTTYSKTNNMKSSRRRICRFLHESDTRKFLLDFFFLRPFVCMIAEFVSLNVDKNYNYFLFVKNGRRLHSEQLRKIFVEKFVKYGAKTVSFQQFRHLAKHISLQLLQTQLPDTLENTDAETDEEDESEGIHTSRLVTAMSAQFGHSRVVGKRNYAITEGDHKDVDNIDLSMYEACSKMWQSFLESGRFSNPIPPRNITGSESTAIVSLPVRQQIVEVVVDQVVTVPASKLQFPECAGKDQAEICLTLLRRFFGRSAAIFQSKEQHYAIKQVLFTSNNLLVVLPTGGGKSLLFFLKAFQDSQKAVLVVVPTVALRSDLARRAALHGLSFCFGISQYRNERLILATTDAVTQSDFLFHLQRLSREHKISKIFIDEAHCFVTDSDFRSPMSRLTFLLSVPVPIVLMTATAPRWIESILVQEFFKYKIGQIIRASTNRPNIVYSVEKNGSSNRAIELVQEWVEQIEESDRIIVYFNSTSVLEIFHGQLEEKSISASRYHASLSEASRNSSFSSWVDGRMKIMLCTTAFGVGIDYPHVRKVLIFGLPFAFEDLVQMCGRAGRDGAEAAAKLLFSDHFDQTFSEGINGKGLESLQLVRDYAESNSCRRELISSYMDISATACFLQDENVQCDNCRSASSTSGQNNVIVAPHQALQFLTTSRVDGIRNNALIENFRIVGLLEKVRAICPICYVLLEQLMTHPVLNCPNLHRTCAICQGLDQSSSHWLSKFCPCKTKNTKVRGTCGKCFLPYEIGGDEVHSLCSNDFVFSYAVAMFKHKPLSVGFRGTFTQYLDWLKRSNGKYLNIASMFLELLEKL